MAMYRGRNLHVNYMIFGNLDFEKFDGNK